MDRLPTMTFAVLVTVLASWTPAWAQAPQNPWKRDRID